MVHRIEAGRENRNHPIRKPPLVRMSRAYYDCALQPPHARSLGLSIRSTSVSGRRGESDFNSREGETGN